MAINDPPHRRLIEFPMAVHCADVNDPPHRRLIETGTGWYDSTVE